MSKSLCDVIADLIQVSRVAARTKALEAVKSRSCEWPSTSDEYSRLVSALCECARTASTSCFPSALGALDFVVDDFGKALASALTVEDRESRPTFPATTRAIQLAVWALTDARTAVNDAEGGLEYVCKLIRSLVSNLLQVNNPVSSFTGGVAAAFVYTLLEFPATRPRQLDIIRGTISQVVTHFPFEFDQFGYEKIFESVLGYFSRSSRIPEMSFGFQLVSTLILRCPLIARETLVIKKPELGSDLVNRLLAILAPSLTSSNPERSGQLSGICIESLRLLLTLIASGSDGECSIDLAQLEALEHVLVPSSPETVDLLIDVKLMRMWCYESVLESSWELGDSLTARVIERWHDHSKWTDAFFVEAKLVRCLGEKQYWLSAAAIARKITASEGMTAMMKTIFTPNWLSEQSARCPPPGFLDLVVAIVAFIPPITDDWLSKVEISDSISALVFSELVIAHRYRSERTVIMLSKFLSVTEITRLVLSVFGEKGGHLIPPRFEDDEISNLRDCLALRGVAPYQSVSGALSSRSNLGKGFKFIEALVRSSLGSDEVTIARLTGVYVLLGSMDIGVVKCDSCLLTSAVSLAVRGLPSKALSELKDSLVEANQVLNAGLFLCPCEAHTDSGGEPRSLLSQISVGLESLTTPMGRFSSTLCVTHTGRLSVVRKRIQTIESLSTAEQLETARELILLSGEENGGKEILIHLSIKSRFRYSPSSVLRKLGYLVSAFRTSVTCLNDSFLNLFLEGKGYCGLFLASHLTPRLSSVEERMHLVDHFCLDCSDVAACAIRLAAGIEAPAVLAPIIICGTYALYCIEQLKMRLPRNRVRILVGSALVHAVSSGAPDDLVSLIAEELDLVHVVDALRRPGNVVLSIVSGKPLPASKILPENFSPIDLVVVCMEVLQVLREANPSSRYATVEEILGTVKLNFLKSLENRRHFTEYLSIQFPDFFPINQALLPSKRTRTHDCAVDLMTLQITSDRSMASASIESLSKSFLYAAAISACQREQRVPLMYGLQQLVGPGHLPMVVDICNQLGFKDPPDPLDLKLVFNVAGPKRSCYPTNPISQLVSDLSDLEPITLAVATNANLATTILPFFILLTCVDLNAIKRSENIRIMNASIEASPATTGAIVHGLCGAKFLEYRWRRRTSFPSYASILSSEFSKSLNLLQLARNCISINRPEDAYFVTSLIPTGSGGSFDLFTPPPGQLPVMLEALDMMGVRIYSLNVSLHASIRPLVSRLRQDALSLLHEEDKSHGLRMLGITSRIEAISSWPTQPTDWLTGTIEILGSSPLSVSIDRFADILSTLRNAALFTPSVADDRVQCLGLLGRVARKQRRYNQARVVYDFAISEAITPTTSPPIRLRIFYGLAKALWGSGQQLEAANLMTHLCQSSQTPVSASMLSRTVEWIGELHLFPIEEIRGKFFTKFPHQTTTDLKSLVKSKIRFVKVLDSACNSKQLIVEELGLLCDILSSGVVTSESRSAWFASRLVSLWFANPGCGSQVVGKYRAQLASCKSLLPFFYQIASRLSPGPNDTGEFRKELILFIIECAKNYPNVCVPPILQLRHIGMGQSKGQKPVTEQAELVVDKLIKSSSSELKTLMESMIAAFRFYYNLAMLKINPAAPPKKFLVTEVEGYREYAKSFSSSGGRTPVLTTNDGSSFVQSIEPEYAIADSGKSLPKIVTVVDIHGRRHKQIVKGNDDLRNDAVLQQLFSLIDSATSASMRSYKVVPISACAGIAEWVANTTTIGSYLVGYPDESTGAHCRYEAGDLAPAVVKTKMVQARQQNKDLLGTYLACCEKFKPCMRYYFYENFPSPKTWVLAQARYSSSVAATSIAGAITGLGDRHCNNILIDLSSGEVIHIDYGICFDAGRSLKIPEIVPFRLTRDMVDGLGPLGAQGPFAKTCEDILSSLKKNSSLVTAVVEVFVVDPLFNWAVASLGSDNALEALNGVKRKLQGFMESSDVIQLSPSAQIDRLIRAATDPRNLCQMFAGWQAWL